MQAIFVAAQHIKLPDFREKLQTDWS